MTHAERQALNKAEKAILNILRDTRIDEDTSERELRRIAAMLVEAAAAALTT